MNPWRIKFEDRKFSLDINIKDRFPVMNLGFSLFKMVDFWF